MRGMTRDYTRAIMNLQRAGAAQNAWTPYVGVFEVAPVVDVPDGTEMSYAGYVRQAVTWSAPADAEANGAQFMNNSGDVLFPALDIDRNALAVGIWDAASGGNLKGWGPIVGGGLAPAGSVIRFVGGTLAWVED